MSATVTLDSPSAATLPSAWSSASTPYDSAAGTCGSSRCSWSRSSRSVFSLRSASSVCCRRYSGRPTGRQIPGPGRTRPTLVAIRRPCGYGCSASARISSLTFGPYESAVSMKSTPSSTARRATLMATLRSAGSPQMPGPVRRMAPKPRRWTVPRSLTSKVPLLRAGVADVIAATTGAERPLFRGRGGVAGTVLERRPPTGHQMGLGQGAGPSHVVLDQGAVELGVLGRPSRPGRCADRATTGSGSAVLANSSLSSWLAAIATTASWKSAPARRAVAGITPSAAARCSTARWSPPARPAGPSIPPLRRPPEGQRLQAPTAPRSARRRRPSLKVRTTAHVRGRGVTSPSATRSSQRIAHRDPADRHLGRDVALHQSRSGRPSTVDDLLAQHPQPPARPRARIRPSPAGGQARCIPRVDRMPFWYTILVPGTVASSVAVAGRLAAPTLARRLQHRLELRSDRSAPTTSPTPPSAPPAAPRPRRAARPPPRPSRPRENPHDPHRGHPSPVPRRRRRPRGRSAALAADEADLEARNDDRRRPRWSSPPRRSRPGGCRCCWRPAPTPTPRTTSSDSAFLYAGAEGYNEILRATLRHGADVKSTNRFGGTALIPASEHGHTETVRILINAGVPLDHVNDLGWTAMLEAIVLERRLGRPGRRGAAADRGGGGHLHPGRERPHSAVVGRAEGYDEIVDLIDDADADPGARSALDHGRPGRRRRPGRGLLDQHASIAARDATGRTALVAAAYGNHLRSPSCCWRPAPTPTPRTRPSRAPT